MTDNEIGFADSLPEKQVFKSGAVRASAGKAKISLVSPHLINETAKVLTFGAQKYSERNWEKGFPWSDPYSALQRHLNAWWAGEELEGESGLHHLGFAACNLMFLIHFVAEKGGTDDRYPLSAAMNFVAQPEGFKWPEKKPAAGFLSPKIEEPSSIWKSVSEIDGRIRNVLWKRKTDNGFTAPSIEVYGPNEYERSLPYDGFFCEIPS